MKSSGEMGRTTKTLLESYELYARATGFSQARIDQMRTTVGLLDQFLDGIKDIREVTADDFRRFLADLRDRPAWRGLKTEQAHRLSGTSITTYGRAVKTFFSWLHTEGIIADNPLATVKIPRNPKTLPKVYSEQDLIAVFAAAAASIRDEAIFCLFLDSGVRLAELSRLKMSDVDTQSGTLKVHGKGNKERFAYFSADAAKCVGRYVKEFRQGAAKGDFLFVTKDGHPLQARGIQSLLLRLGKKAGLEERLAPHKLRHSFATLSLKYGGNLEYIRKILGHTDIKTTSEAYLNVQDADVSAAHRRFSPLSNLQGAIAKKGSVLPDEAKPGDQAVLPRTQPEKQSYLETPHKRQMRELAKATAEGIRLPSHWDKKLWRDLSVEFRPGKYYLPIGAVEIKDDRQIKVKYYDIGAGIAEPHLVKGLFSHLSTSRLSKFTELVGDKGMLSGLVFKAGQYSQALLQLLKLITDEVKGYRTKVDFHDEGKPGLTKWFIISAWNDAIQKAGGHSWIDNSWYKPYENVPVTNYWQLRGGGAVIGIAKSKSTLKFYETWHKKLILKYATDPLAKDIAVKDQELGSVVQDVKQRLQEFSDMQQVPGYCELC